jgi:hypothetical protein
MKLRESEDLAAELLLVICQQAAAGGAADSKQGRDLQQQQQHQHQQQEQHQQQRQQQQHQQGSQLTSPACTAPGVLTGCTAHPTVEHLDGPSGSLLGAASGGAAIQNPATAGATLPPQLTAHKLELNLLTTATVAATAARLKSCQACPVGPYHLFNPPPVAIQGRNTLEAQFAAHHAEQMSAARPALSHAGAAICLLNLCTLLLSHYGDQLPASISLAQLAARLLSMLEDLRADSLCCFLGPWQPGGRHLGPNYQWQVHQYTAAKQRRRLIKLLLNSVLQCLGAVVGSEAGWEAVLGVLLGTLQQQLRQTQQQQGSVMEWPAAVVYLRPLLMLVQRPAFKVSLTGGVHAFLHTVCSQRCSRLVRLRS